MAIGWLLIMADDNGAREVTIRADSYESALNLAADTYPDASVVSHRRVSLPDDDETDTDES